MLQEIEKTFRGNTIYKGNGFEISYNPCVMKTPFDDIFNMVNSDDESAGQEETCLYVGDEYAILKGDFRKEFGECNSFEEAEAFYNNSENKSSWTTINIC